MCSPEVTEYTVSVGPSFINATDIAIERVLGLRAGATVEDALNIIFLHGVNAVIEELRK